MTLPESSSASHRPVLIIGGGLVGASLAIALDAAGVDTLLVEAAAPRTDAQPSYDERNLALARATVNGLEAIGVWKHVRAGGEELSHLDHHAAHADCHGPELGRDLYEAL